MANKTKDKTEAYFRKRYPDAYTMRDNIRQLSERHGVTVTELANAAHKSRKTLERRMEEPYLFVEAEIIDICRVLGVTSAQIRVEPVFPTPEPIQL
jgi:DNA-binding XRE family transcriptional regulator